jgi:hypothetical protein
MRREELAILRFDPSSRAVFSNRLEGTYPTSADWSFVTGSKVRLAASQALKTLVGKQ